MATAARVIAVPLQRSRRRRPPRRWRRWAEPYLLLAPAFILVMGVIVYPVCYLFYVAFHSTSYFQVGRFAGWHNFQPLASSQGVNSFVATAEFVLASDVLTLAIALVMAVLLEAPLVQRGLFRTAVMLPWLVSQVVAGLLWQALLDPNLGAISELLRAVLGWSVAPLSDPHGAMAALVAANVWRSYPLALVLILAAVQAVPHELYEAARLDGATRRNEMRYILLPSIGRSLAVVLILLTLEFFTTTTMPLVLTGGGPSEATFVLALRVWHEAFISYHFGLSAAVGLVIFVINLAVTIYYIRNFVVERSARVP